MADFGQAKNLVSNTITLNLPAGCQYWFIHNQDIAPLQITAPGLVGGPCLKEAGSAGSSGEWIDSFRFPFFPSSFTLTSAGASPVSTGQFGAWASTAVPQRP